MCFVWCAYVIMSENCQHFHVFNARTESDRAVLPDVKNKTQSIGSARFKDPEDVPLALPEISASSEVDFITLNCTR